MTPAPFSRTEQIDKVFFALAHPVRRGILQCLRTQDMTVAQVSQPFAESPAAITKHLAVLERAKLISRRKSGRQHILRFDTNQLHEAAAWMRVHTSFWNAQMDALADYAEDVKKHGIETKNKKGGENDEN